VQATKVESASSKYAIFDLDSVETIADPLLLFRGRTVLGVETEFDDPGWHDSMTFWAGAAAGGVRTSYCAYFQHIDPSVQYVLLLGLDGPYALEPIAGKSDRWLKTVRDYFKKSKPRVIPKIGLPDALDQITVVEASGCVFDAEADEAIDAFLGCIHRVGRPSRIPVTLMLNYLLKVHVIATGDEPVLKRKDLLDELKTDFGWPEEIPLRSLLDKSLVLTTSDAFQEGQ
jgi:hypothetical protein